VLEGWADVEPILRAEIPRSAEGWFIVNLDTAPRWAHGCGIKVECSEQGFPGRRSCCDRCGPEEIKCEFGVGYEEVPAIRRERRRCASEDGKKMVLEGADGAFSSIAAMDVRRDKL
jgi:hypothetical protein